MQRRRSVSPDPSRADGSGACEASAVKRQRTKTRPQKCCCGKAGAVCRGDNVKAAGVGLRLPFGEPGSENYMERERLLREVGVTFCSAGSCRCGAGGKCTRTKAQMMASKDLRVSRKHFPGNRTTPSKKFNARPGARSLRHTPNVHGDRSVPVDKMMEDTMEAEIAAGLPHQQGVTRGARRLIEGGAPPAAAASPGAGAEARAACMNLCAETGEAALLEAKLRAEIEALKGQAARDQQGRQELQRKLAEQTQKVTRLEGEADKLRGTIEKRDAQYKAKLAEIKKDLETQREAGSGYRPITVSTLREKRFRDRTRQYTSFPSPEAFEAWLDCLNADGLLDSVSVKKVFDESGDGVDATNAPSSVGASAAAAAPKPHGNRALAPKDAILLTTFLCRTGIDIIDVHSLFDLGYSTACRYFAVYVSFLRWWLEEEFPLPTEEQLQQACPESFRKAFPGRQVQYIIDAHEQQCEEPSNLVNRRTVWSDYKHRTTNKFLGACSPCGACVFASTNYGGKCDDRTLTTATGLLDTVFKGWTTLADKGFMMHAEFGEQGHELLTPTHAVKNVPTYSVDESKWTNAIGKTRIHVERMFRRAQEWKILHNIIKVSNMDLAGSIFKVCCYMTNYEPPLIRQRDDMLVSLAELQWGRQ